MKNTSTAVQAHSLNHSIIQQAGSYDVISADLFTKWAKYIDAAPKTIETYKKSIKQFANYLQDNGIKQPTREDVIAYRDGLMETHKPSTVQGYLIAVRLFFQWAELEGFYIDITRHIKAPKLDREHKKSYLTSSQSKQLLDKIDTSTPGGKRDYAIIALMLTTGLRTISVINANVNDIRPLGDNMALYYQGKGHTEKAAAVMLAPPVEKAINEYLATRTGTGKDSPLFASLSPRNEDERLTTKSISRLCKNALKAIGIDREDVTAHSLRHTFAMANIMNGGSITDTQQVLDHKNITTTMIYLDLANRQNNKSEERVAAALFS